MRRTIWAMSWVVGVLLAGSAWAQNTPVPAGVKPDQAAKIKAALPAEAPAKPAKARKLLVLSRTFGFRHSSIACGAYAIVAMGEKTGAYTATHTEDIDLFEPEKLKDFDAVLMLNTTGELFTPKDYGKLTDEQKKAADEKALALKTALLDFVASGKGLVGIHAATDTFYKWPEYGLMIGGYFDGHPWQAHEKVSVKVEDPDHPINAAFKGKAGFDIVDEIYQIRNPYSREKLRVLLGLDGGKMDLTLSEASKKKGLKRADQDYPVAWVRTQGQGRVFYCSLGHNEHIYWDVAVLQHYLAGLQFALGDLKADATPLPKR